MSLNQPFGGCVEASQSIQEARSSGNDLFVLTGKRKCLYQRFLDVCSQQAARRAESTGVVERGLRGGERTTAQCTTPGLQQQDSGLLPRTGVNGDTGNKIAPVPGQAGVHLLDELQQSSRQACPLRRQELGQDR